MPQAEQLAEKEKTEWEQDAQLVTAAQQGSHEAFTALVERNYRLVYILCLAQLRNPDSAEELTQEVFVRVHLHLHKLREPIAFGGWLRRIARNEALRWHSRNQTRSELLPLIPMEDLETDVLDSRAVSPRQQAAENQELNALREAIDRLPAADREMVLLHYIEGQSKSDLARHLGMHHTTVGRQLERIKASLRTELDPFVGQAVELASVRPSGLARTVAAVAAVASMSAVERESLAQSAIGALTAASEPAASVAIGSAPAALAGTKAGMLTAFGLSGTKLLVTAAVVATAGVVAYVVPRQMKKWVPTTGIHATIPDAEFQKPLQSAPPPQYMMEVRKSNQLTPAAKLPPGRISDALQATVAGSLGTRTITRTAGFADNSFASILKNLGASYNTAHLLGSASEGFQGRLMAMPVSATFAAIRNIPSWSVEHLPANAPLIDTAFRTPAFSNVKAAPGLNIDQTNKLYGSFFNNVNETLSTRFLQEAQLKLASRTITVPVIRLKPVSTAAGNASQHLPAIPGAPTPASVSSQTGANQTAVLSTWKTPITLDRAIWAFRVTNPYPALIEVDPSIASQQPAKWPGELQLISGAYPAELAQQLSHVYNVVAEVALQETPVYLVYDPLTADERQVQAWHSADSKVTSLR